MAGAEGPKELMPFWLTLVTASVKTLVTMLVFGPPSALSEAAEDTHLPGGLVLTPDDKDRMKLAFTAFLCGLFVYTLCGDVAELVDLWLHSDSFLEFYVGAVAVVTTSSNFATGFTVQALFEVFSSAAEWRILHSGPPEEELETTTTPPPGYVFSMILKKQGQFAFGFFNAAWLLYLVVFFPLWAPLLPCLILFLPQIVLLWVPMEFVARGMSSVIFWLHAKKRDRQSHSLVAGEGFREKTDVAQMRAVMTREKGGGASMEDDEIGKEYGENMRAFHLTGCTAHSWNMFFQWQIFVPVIIAMYSLCAARFALYLDLTGPGRLWDRVLTPAFTGDGREELKLAYVRASSRTLWERKTPVYVERLKASLMTKVKFLNALV